MVDAIAGTQELGTDEAGRGSLTGRWFVRLVGRYLRHYAKRTRIRAERGTEELLSRRIIRTACIKSALSGAAAGSLTTGATLLTAETQGLAALWAMPVAALGIGGEMLYRAVLQVELTFALAEIHGIAFDPDDPKALWRLYALAFRKPSEAGDEDDGPGKDIIERVMEVEGEEVGHSIGEHLLGESLLRNVVPVVGIASSSIANYRMTKRVGETISSYFRYQRALHDAIATDGSRCHGYVDLLVEGMWFVFTADGRLVEEEAAILSWMLESLPEAERTLVKGRMTDDELDWTTRLERIPEPMRDAFLHALEVAAAVDGSATLPERKLIRRAAHELGRPFEMARLDRMIASFRENGTLGAVLPGAEELGAKKGRRDRAATKDFFVEAEEREPRPLPRLPRRPELAELLPSDQIRERLRRRLRVAAHLRERERALEVHLVDEHAHRRIERHSPGVEADVDDHARRADERPRELHHPLLVGVIPELGHQLFGVERPPFDGDARARHAAHERRIPARERELEVVSRVDLVNGGIDLIAVVVLAEGRLLIGRRSRRIDGSDEEEPLRRAVEGGRLIVRRGQGRALERGGLEHIAALAGWKRNDAALDEERARAGDLAPVRGEEIARARVMALEAREHGGKPTRGGIELLREGVHLDAGGVVHAAPHREDLGVPSVEKIGLAEEAIEELRTRREIAVRAREDDLAEERGVVRIRARGACERSVDAPRLARQSGDERRALIGEERARAVRHLDRDLGRDAGRRAEVRARGDDHGRKLLEPTERRARANVRRRVLARHDCVDRGERLEVGARPLGQRRSRAFFEDVHRERTLDDLDVISRLDRELRAVEAGVEIGEHRLFARHAARRTLERAIVEEVVAIVASEQRRGLGRQLADELHVRARGGVDLGARRRRSDARAAPGRENERDGDGNERDRRSTSVPPSWPHSLALPWRGRFFW